MFGLPIRSGVDGRSPEARPAKRSRCDARYLALVAFIFCGAPQAASLTVELRDNNGKPLSEAVVWIEPAAGDPAAPQDRLPAERPLVMDQQKRLFTPYILPVQRGTRVIFPNSDPINHHVYSFSPAKRFELRLHHQGDSAQEVTFDKPGLVSIGCNIHDSMQAFIQVVDTPFARKSDESGRVVLRGVPAQVRQVRVYHPLLRSPGNQMVVNVDASRNATVPVTVRLRRPAPRHHDY